MPQIFKNKWFIVGVSLLGLLYTAGLLAIDYAVLFYDIQYENKVVFAVVYSIISLLFGLLYFYTRKSFVTSAAAMFNMLFLFPALLLDWGNWPLLIPAIIVTLFTFFACGMGDTAKTIFGTIFLLMYIIGGVAFFLIVNIFNTKTIDTVLEEQVSPDGQYRYILVDVQNQANGKMIVYVEPNTLDKEIGGFLKLRATGYQDMVKQVNRQSGKDEIKLDCQWVGDSTLYINGEHYAFEIGEWQFDF
ncbi:MAG: hypothetical protein J5999_08025 [Oscillospiraceae bacterium]|nr:hypothetical protein [Oscillospiraceae bacterium]